MAERQDSVQSETAAEEGAISASKVLFPVVTISAPFYDFRCLYLILLPRYVAAW